ncbi:hypothetical protein BDR22DRAFT_888502 [Usnea florida]
MTDTNEAGESSNAAVPPHDNGPDQRSRYVRNFELDNNQPFEPYKVKDTVYLKGARGVDPKPYKIYQVLGHGQYKLSRDGRSDGQVHGQDELKDGP